MIRVDGVYVELAAVDLEALAAFYERTFGFERLDTGPAAISVVSGSAYLRIVPASGLTGERPPLCLAVSAGMDLDNVRSEATAAGAMVLTESKREGVMRLVMQDPAGNALEIVQRPEIRALPPVANASVATDSTIPASSIPVSGRAMGARVTRRDVDRLRDSERLAAMQETIAGLHVAFDPNDPAAVMDDMRAKLGTVPASDIARQLAEEQARAASRAAEADEIFARYRAAIVEPAIEDVPQTPAPAPQQVPETDGLEAVEPPKTLGRSKNDDDDEPPESPK